MTINKKQSISTQMSSYKTDKISVLSDKIDRLDDTLKEMRRDVSGILVALHRVLCIANETDQRSEDLKHRFKNLEWDTIETYERIGAAFRIKWREEMNKDFS